MDHETPNRDPQGGLSFTGDPQTSQSPIQGNIKAARFAIIPAENKRSFLDINTDVIDKIDPIFYNDVETATFKGLDLN